MRNSQGNPRSGAAKANAPIALLLLGAVVAIIVTLLNRESEDTRTGARYAEQARKATAIDAEQVTWEEVTPPLDLSMDFPAGMAVATKGHVFVVGDRLVVLRPEETTTGTRWVEASRSEPFSEEYHDVAIDPAGRLVAATASRLEWLMLEDDGESPTLQPGVFKTWNYEPEWSGVGFTSLAVSDGVVYLADALGRRVFRHSLDPAGPGQEVLASGFNVPSTMDVSVTPDGELVTVDPGRHQIQVRDVYGDVVRSFGENGNRLDQFHGCCNPIAIASLSDGRWVTAEKGLGVTRVKVYSEDGEFETVVAGPEQFDEPSSGPPIKLDVAVDSKDRILVLDPVRKQVRTFTPKGGEEVNRTSKQTSRRELMIGLVRWGALGLLAGGGLFLWRRNGTTDPCHSSLPCASCPANGRCELVRAEPGPKTVEPPRRSEP